MASLDGFPSQSCASVCPFRPKARRASLQRIAVLQHFDVIFFENYEHKIFASKKPGVQDVPNPHHNCSGPRWEITGTDVSERYHWPTCSLMAVQTVWKKMQVTDNRCPRKFIARPLCNIGTHWRVKILVWTSAATSHCNCAKKNHSSACTSFSSEATSSISLGRATCTNVQERERKVTVEGDLKREREKEEKNAHPASSSHWTGWWFKFMGSGKRRVAIDVFFSAVGEKLKSTGWIVRQLRARREEDRQIESPGKPWAGTSGKLGNDGSLSCEVTWNVSATRARIFWKDWNCIRQTQKEQCEVCWREG